MDIGRTTSADAKWGGRMDSTRETKILDDAHFHREAENITEALCNLVYLICEEADHPEKVRRYASMSEERLNAMAELLRARFKE
jgi:hypothetical protein